MVKTYMSSVIKILITEIIVTSYLKNNNENKKLITTKAPDSYYVFAHFQLCKKQNH